MKNYKTITVKKLYNGHCSIRDYIVRNTIMNGKGLKIKYQNHIMTLNCEDLAHPFQFHKRNFESKFGTQQYQLIDFAFCPDSLKA